eukprot:scaffold22962_cov68-Skeletonema_marinoi.AAC.1
MSEPVAFPRGKRKSTTSTTKDDTSHPSKKHAPSASSTSAVETIEKDFLFGSSATSSDLADTGRSKRGGSSSSSSQQQQYYDMSPSVVSQLPLGGGA